MAPWKRTMSTVMLLILGSIPTNVFANITKTPSSGLFLEGSDVTLTCVVQDNDNVIWEEDATSIFVGKEKYTEKKKYDNFEISSGDGDFSLTIKDVHLSDEGTYVCKDKDRLANATVTVGVLPTLYIYVKETEAMYVPHTSTHVNITCSAYNARPAVSVFELGVIDSEKTVNVKNDAPNQNGDGETYNSSATVPFIMSSNDISVYCRVYTAGQSLNHTEKFNLPRCNITISGNEVRCRCKANPPVDKYRMELNGNLRDGDVLYIEESNSANVTCFGTNGMGTGLSSILFHGDKAGFGIFSVVVTISVGVVLMVLAVICINRRMSSRRGKSDVSIENPKNHCTGVPMNATITNYLHEPHNMEHEDVSSICPVDLMTTSTCGRIKSSEDKIIFGPGFSCANSLTKDVKHEEFLETDEFKPKSLADQMNASERGLPSNLGIPNEPHASRLATSMPDYRVSYITLDHGDNHNNFLGIHKQENTTVYATITHNDKIVQRQQGLETSSE